MTLMKQLPSSHGCRHCPVVLGEGDGPVGDRIVLLGTVTDWIPWHWLG